MKLITESLLRQELKNSNIREYVVEEKTIVTPSAKQYLSEKHIKLIYKNNILSTDYSEKDNINNDDKNLSNTTFENNSSNLNEINIDMNLKENIFKPKYIHINGGLFEEKPEYMTQLNKNVLVCKDHKRIIFRGKLDSLQAKIIEAQIQAKMLNEELIYTELEEILTFTRKILGCEVIEEKLQFESLIGLTPDELRKYSHNPKKYLNTEHIIFPSATMGPVVVILNSLRAQTREVEISAYEAFKLENGNTQRPDIEIALNRLSSCFYVMMCKYIAGKYTVV